MEKIVSAWHAKELLENEEEDREMQRNRKKLVAQFQKSVESGLSDLKM